MINFLSCNNIVILNRFKCVDNISKTPKIIYYVKYHDFYGFKYNNFYFLANKNIFNQTFKNNAINFEWNVFVEYRYEMLKVFNEIYVLTIDRNQSIEYVFNLNTIGSLLTINNYNIIILKRDLTLY